MGVDRVRLQSPPRGEWVGVDGYSLKTFFCRRELTGSRGRIVYLTIRPLRGLGLSPQLSLLSGLAKFALWLIVDALFATSVFILEPGRTPAPAARHHLLFSPQARGGKWTCNLSRTWLSTVTGSRCCSCCSFRKFGVVPGDAAMFRAAGNLLVAHV